MNILSITVNHYPNASKRKKPLIPIKHVTDKHAYLEIRVCGKGFTDTTLLVCNLSSAPVQYKAKIALQYVSEHVDKRTVSLPKTILYQDIVDWIGIPILT